MNRGTNLVSAVLGAGAKQSQPARKLAELLEVDIRTIQQIVRDERLAGTLICSNGSGYFMPTDTSDVKYTISRLYKQARESRKVAEAMQKALNESS